MSATGIKPGVRRENDSYSTPAWVVEAALNLVDTTPRSILDPGAGSGIWGKVARAKWPKAHICGVEIERGGRPDPYNSWRNEDFLAWSAYMPMPDSRFDLVMSNPPFNLAEEFVHASLRLVTSGLVLMLLRLAFLEGQRRYETLWKPHPPAFVRVLPKRPSFTGGGTDSAAYAVFGWKKGHVGPFAGGWL